MGADDGEHAREGVGHFLDADEVDAGDVLFDGNLGEVLAPLAVGGDVIEEGVAIDADEPFEAAADLFLAPLAFLGDEIEVAGGAVAGEDDGALGLEVAAIDDAALGLEGIGADEVADGLVGVEVAHDDLQIGQAEKDDGDDEVTGGGEQADALVHDVGVRRLAVGSRGHLRRRLLGFRGIARRCGRAARMPGA